MWVHTWMRAVVAIAAVAMLAACSDREAPPSPAPTATPGDIRRADSATPATATDGFTPIPPFEMQQRLGRGINLGNALEAPREGEWGVTIADYFFPLIRQAGFDTVRVPIRWSAHALREPPYTIAPDFFERIDWVVEQALNNDLNVVINVHHYDELFQDPDAEWDRFLALWAQIADRYKDYPPTLLFEVLNEPNGALTTRVWNVLFEDTLRVIRQTNPTRNVVLTGANWGQLASLFTVRIPDDPYLIATFHYYEPKAFTHQGASWVQDAGEWIGTRWEGNEDQRRAIDRAFDAVARWSKDKNIPVWMGEFGAFGLHADMEDRARWTAYVARAAEQRGITWAYWEFGAGFGVYDLVTQQWVEPLLRAMIPQ